MSRILAAGLLAATCLSPLAAATAGSTDLAYAVQGPHGRDFAQAPIGQSFVALAPSVRAGIRLADQGSFIAELAAQYPGEVQGFPYPIAQSIKVRAQLLAGQGSGGTVLDSRELTLALPSSGYVEINYAALGIVLGVGQTYTLLLSDASNQAYPNGISGWVVPAVFDYGATAVAKPGAYASGLPVIQNSLQTSDAGIGDHSFEVADTTTGSSGDLPTQATLPSCAAANATITSVGRGFFVINGGLNLNDHVWYAPQAGTRFEGGTTTFVIGEVVDVSGTAGTQGCYADLTTVKPARAALQVDGVLPFPQASVAYAATLQPWGGTAPFAWTAAGLPAGLSFANGSFSGTATTAGAYSVAVTLTDARGLKASANYALSVLPAPTCTKPGTAKAISGSGRVNAVSSTSVTIGLTKLALNACTKTTFPAGKTALAVGQQASYTGYSVGSTRTALTITVR